MADETIPSNDDEWIIEADDAFHHLTRVAAERLPAEQASYDLHESLLVGRARAIRRYGPNTVPIPASLWRHQLDLIIVDGHLVVVERPLPGLIGGGVNRRASGVFLSARDVERLWPSAATAAATAEPTKPVEPATAVNPTGAGLWIIAECRSLQAAGKIPEGIRRGQLANLLAKRMNEAAGPDGFVHIDNIDKDVRKVSAAHINNNLVKWGLWDMAEKRITTF